MNLSFQLLIEMSVSAGILILFILLLRKMTQTLLPKTMFLLLWDIVMIRLLLPFIIPAKISWFSFITSLFEKTDKHDFIQQNPAITGESKLFLSNSIFHSRTLFLIIWITGIVLCVSYFLFFYCKSYMKLRESLPLANTECLNQLLEELPLKRTISFQVSDQITTPITYGLFKPRIVLPTFIPSENTIQLKHIITHEYIHIKRFDCIRKWLSILAVSIHWFNPLVWLMYFRFNDDLEIICDAQVIQVLGEEEKETYANSLIQLAEQQNHFFTLYQGFGKSAVKERIISIMKYKKTTTFGIGCAVLLLAVSTTVFASTSVFTLKESVPAESEKPSSTVMKDSSPYVEKENEKAKSDEDAKITFTKTSEEYPVTVSKKDDTISIDIKEQKESKNTDTGKPTSIPAGTSVPTTASVPTITSVPAADKEVIGEKTTLEEAIISSTN